MSILDDLTDPQREAVTHIDGPLLVVAGAGSGKTRVITRRVAYLIEQGVSPFNIVAITFTNKAAGEMKERVAEMCPIEGMWISTFHSMCARLLRRHADRLGYTSSYTIYDSADQLACIKEVLHALEIDQETLRPAAAAGYISDQKNAFVSVQKAVEAASRWEDELRAKVYAGYQKRLAANNAMDFDDLLVNMVHLLMQHPDILERYQRAFQYILIDEYQDTNHCQYMIARLLAQAHQNICATGDPDQSIYGWRGADIQNILDFEKDYPNCKTVTLDRNYRSTQTILSGADALIENNLSRKPKRLWTDHGAGGPIRELLVDDEVAEGDHIAQVIMDMVEDGARHGDVAVFYRVNAQSRAIEDGLRRASIPYEIVMGVEFYQRREVKDVLAYLRLCANPADNVSFLRIVNVPTRGIGKSTIEKIKDFSERMGLSLLEAVRHPDVATVLSGRARTSVQKFVDLIDGFVARPQSPVEPFVHEVIDKSGYLKHLGKDADADDRIANVMELASAAAEFDRVHGEEATLTAFLEEVALVSDVDELDESTDKVHLMTLHASKGLEFPIVFIAGVEQGMLPHARATEAQEDEGLEEERRLMYVGMTRAKRHLILTHAAERTVFGRTNYCIPSIFLDEIPLELRQVEEKTELVRYDSGFDFGGDDDDWDDEEREFQLEDMGG